VKFLKALLKDLLDQVWTLVALAIGYIVLTGTARTLTGYLIIGTLILWTLTFPLRYDRNSEESDS
jgi:hypothetical protein